MAADLGAQNSEVLLGREWVFLKLIKEPGMVISTLNSTLLLGGPGSGKTALMRHIGHNPNLCNGNLLGQFYCDQKSTAFDLVFSLASQLQKRIPYLRVPTMQQLAESHVSGNLSQSSSRSLGGGTTRSLASSEPATSPNPFFQWQSMDERSDNLLCADYWNTGMASELSRSDLAPSLLGQPASPQPMGNLSPSRNAMLKQLGKSSSFDASSMDSSALLLESHALPLVSDEPEPCEDIFWRFVLEPVIDHGLNRWEDRCFFIIIDSVDLRRDIYELISRHLRILPNFIHLILSARFNRRKGLIRMFSGCRRVILDDTRKQAVLDDMCLYVSSLCAQFSLKLTNGQKQRICICSDGCYLYTRGYLEKIKRDLLKLSDHPPATLNGLHFALFTRLFEKNGEYMQCAKYMFSLMLISQDLCVSRDNLIKIFEMDTKWFDKLLDLLQQYDLISIKKDESERVWLCFGNESIMNWLSDVKHCGSRFYCSAQLGHLLCVLRNERIEQSSSDLATHIQSAGLYDLSPSMHAMLFLLLCKPDQLPQTNNDQRSYRDQSISSAFAAPHNALLTYIADCANSNACRSPVYEGSCTLDGTEAGSELMGELQSGDLQLPSISFMDNSSEPSGEGPYHGYLGTLSPTEVGRGTPSPATGRQSGRCTPRPQLPPKLVFDASKPDINFMGFDQEQLVAAIKAEDEPLIRLMLGSCSNLLHVYDERGRTPLLHAISGGCSSQLIELLGQFELDVNQPAEPSQCTALMLAAARDRLEVAERLLEMDADVHARDNYSRSALQLAVSACASLNMVQLLLNWGAHANELDNQGRSLLCLAVIASRGVVTFAPKIEVTQLDSGEDEQHLPKRNASVKYATNRMTAKQKRDLAAKVKLLSNPVETSPSEPDTADDPRWPLPVSKCGLAPSSASADSTEQRDLNSLQVIRTLVDAGANVHARDRNGYTVLHWAGEEGAAAILLDYLIQLGGKTLLEQVDNKGWLPAHSAAASGRVALLKPLVAGGLVHWLTGNGWSVLFCAVRANQFDTVIALVRRCGARLDQLDSKRRSTLHYVTRACGVLLNDWRQECMAANFTLEQLDSSSSDMTPVFSSEEEGETDGDNMNELIEECDYEEYKKRVRMLKLLIALGADVDCRDSKGRSALHVAARYDEPMAIDLLLSGGAKVDAVDSQGRSPLLVCSARGSWRSASRLIKAGAKINWRSIQGETALTLALMRRDARIVSLLLQAGADSSSIHAQDRQALDCKKDAKLIKLLQEHRIE